LNENLANQNNNYYT